MPLCECNHRKVDTVAWLRSHKPLQHTHALLRPVTRFPFPSAPPLLPLLAPQQQQSRIRRRTGDFKGAPKCVVLPMKTSDRVQFPKAPNTPLAPSSPCTPMSPAWHGIYRRARNPPPLASRNDGQAIKVVPRIDTPCICLINSIFKVDYSILHSEVDKMKFVLQGSRGRGSTTPRWRGVFFPITESRHPGPCYAAHLAPLCSSSDSRSLHAHP